MVQKNQRAMCERWQEHAGFLVQQLHLLWSVKTCSFILKKDRNWVEIYSPPALERWTLIRDENLFST